MKYLGKITLVVMVFIFTGCQSTLPKSQTPLENTIQDSIFRANYLHRLNINDAAGLKEELQGWLAIDIMCMWAEIKIGRASQKERSEAISALRLMAIQYEKYPVPSWSTQPEIMAAFSAAIADDPHKTEEMRSRNWAKPWWVD